MNRTVTGRSRPARGMRNKARISSASGLALRSTSQRPLAEAQRLRL
jgi:hypothetical protein